MRRSRRRLISYTDESRLPVIHDSSADEIHIELVVWCHRHWDHSCGDAEENYMLGHHNCRVAGGVDIEVSCLCKRRVEVAEPLDEIALEEAHFHPLCLCKYLNAQVYRHARIRGEML